MSVRPSRQRLCKLWAPLECSSVSAQRVCRELDQKQERSGVSAPSLSVHGQSETHKGAQELMVVVGERPIAYCMANSTLVQQINRPQALHSVPLWCNDIRWRCFTCPMKAQVVPELSIFFPGYPSVMSHIINTLLLRTDIYGCFYPLWGESIKYNVNTNTLYLLWKHGKLRCIFIQTFRSSWVCALNEHFLLLPLKSLYNLA